MSRVVIMTYESQLVLSGTIYNILFIHHDFEGVRDTNEDICVTIHSGKYGWLVEGYQLCLLSNELFTKYLHLTDCPPAYRRVSVGKIWGRSVYNFNETFWGIHHQASSKWNTGTNVPIFPLWFDEMSQFGCVSTKHYWIGCPHSYDCFEISEAFRANFVAVLIHERSYDSDYKAMSINISI